MANIFGNGLIGRVDVNWVQTSGFYWDENHMKVFYTTTTRSDDRCYYLKDHLGSNRMTINSLGVVTNVQDYYAYGEVLRSYNNSTPNEKYNPPRRIPAKSATPKPTLTILVPVFMIVNLGDGQV